MNIPPIREKFVLWKIEPKLKLTSLENYATIEGIDGNSMKLCVKVNRMKQYRSYWEEFWAGSDAIEDPNVHVHLDELRMVFLFETGLTRFSYLPGHKNPEMRFSFHQEPAVALVKQLAELLSLKLTSLAPKNENSAGF